jgi:hypothetical protein
MIMDQIERDVKTIILEVADKKPEPEKLDDETTLDELGYNDPMCGELAFKLRKYVKNHKPTGNINNADISTDITVGDVVKLVRKAISI